MKNQTLLLACLGIGACATPGTPPAPEDHAVEEVAEHASPPVELEGELPDEVTTELMRIEDEQFRLESEMAGLRQEPDDVGWVKRKLANMVAVDQLLRNSMMLPSDRDWEADSRQAFMRIVGEKTIEVDERNTHELRALLERHGWFNVSTFGPDADRDGWLLVQHADRNPAFQKEVLAVLEELVPLGETSPSNFAYLYDRVAGAEGRPQRYGTQGRCVGDSWEPNPLEDPERVDELRAEMGLGTLAEYKALCTQMCR